MPAISAAFWSAVRRLIDSIRFSEIVRMNRRSLIARLHAVLVNVATVPVVDAPAGTTPATRPTPATVTAAIDFWMVVSFMDGPRGSEWLVPASYRFDLLGSC